MRHQTPGVCAMTRTQISVSHQRRRAMIAATILLDPPRTSTRPPAPTTILRHLRRADTAPAPAVSDIFPINTWPADAGGWHSCAAARH